MTNRELIIKTMNFEKTEQIPFAVLNGQMWVCAKHGLTAAQLLDLPDAGAQLLLDEYKAMGTTILTGGAAASWEFVTAMGGTVSMDHVAAEIIKRPLDEISDIDNYDINEVIEKMRSLHYYKQTLLQTKLMREAVGDEYLIGGGYFGPFTVAAQLIGVENMMMELFEDEDGYVEKLLDFSCDIVAAYYEDLIEAGLDLATVPEPVASGDLIGPNLFDEYVLPIDLKLKERLVEKCPNFFMHICGKTDHLVSRLADCKYGIFSVDSIDMVKAQEDSNGRIALFGNLNPAEILAAKTADEVYEISKALCQQMKPYGGFILAPGCDIAPTIPLENLQAMARAAAEA